MGAAEGLQRFRDVGRAVPSDPVGELQVGRRVAEHDDLLGVLSELPHSEPGCHHAVSRPEPTTAHPPVGGPSPARARPIPARAVRPPRPIPARAERLPRPIPARAVRLPRPIPAWAVRLPRPIPASGCTAASPGPRDTARLWSQASRIPCGQAEGSSRSVMTISATASGTEITIIGMPANRPASRSGRPGMSQAMTSSEGRIVTAANSIPGARRQLARRRLAGRSARRAALRRAPVPVRAAVRVPPPASPAGPGPTPADGSSPGKPSPSEPGAGTPVTSAGPSCSGPPAGCVRYPVSASAAVSGRSASRPTASCSAVSPTAVT